MSFDVSGYRESLQKLTLDDLLGQLEIDLSKVGHTDSDAALKMLLKMDQAVLMIAEMSQKNNPIKAEAAQFEYVASSLEKNSGSFLKDIGGKEKLQEVRQKSSPISRQSWWFLDHIHEQQVQRQIRSLAIAFGGIVIVLALFVILYNAFFAPDPIVVKRYGLEMDAEQALSQQDYARALNSVNQALELNSQDPSMIILQGVLYERLGKPADAANNFAKAESSLNDHSQFLLIRADAWIKAGELAKGLQDTQESIRDNPNSAEGYFYFGRVNELMQNYNKAIDAYTRASQLADQQGKVELNATIRMTMAMLMQNIPAFQPTISVTPTK